MTQPPTLSEMEEYLQHASADGTSAGSSATDKKKGRGSGKFDESKVKRDGDGQFAKKDAGEELSWAERNKLNMEWRNGSELLKNRLTEMMTPLLDQKAEAIMAKYGMESFEEFGENEAASREAAQIWADELNRAAEVEGSNVSPSGDQRIEFYPEKDEVKYRYVGLREDTTDTDAAIRRIRKAAKATPEHDGLRFNPTVDISAGRVRQVLPVKHSDITEAPSPTLSEMEAHLEHAAGGREFDESKVKRQGGRFAKKAGGPAQAGPVQPGRPKQDAGPVRKTGRFKGMARDDVLKSKLAQVDKDLGPVKEDMVKDALWASNKTQAETMKKLARDYKGEFRSLAKKASDKIAALEKKGKLTPAAKKQIDREYNEDLVKMMNSKLSGPQAPAYAKSPSGRYAPQFRVGTDGKVKLSVIDTKYGDAPVRKMSDFKAEVGKVLADRAEKINQIRTRWDDALVKVESSSNASAPQQKALADAIKRARAAAEDRLRDEAERERRFAELQAESEDDEDSWWERVRGSFGFDGFGHSALEEVPIPTLSEMEDFLQHDAALSAPTREEMRHYLEENGADAFLEHYGVKGMKWGVRRSAQLLNRIRGKNPREAAVITNDYNERVGGINSDRKGAQVLRDMKPNSVVVVDTEDGPTVVSKQKDGSFRKITMSADAQGVMRTVNKDPAEMSTREMNDAVKRAQAVEAYNKLFNPTMDPNAELKARVEAMDLQMKYAQAHRQMNPTRTKRVATFVNDLKPAFDLYLKVDKQFEGAMSEKLKKQMGLVTGNKTKTPKAEPKSAKPADVGADAYKKPKKSKKDPVYKITTL